MLLCLMGGGGYLRYLPTIQTWLRGGYPGYPLTIQTWMGGTPGTSHYPDLVRGYPGMEYPPDLGQVSPRPRTGYPPPPDLGWGTLQTWDGVLPTPRPGTGYPLPEMVDKVKTLPSVILRMRGVNMVDLISFS